MITMIEKIAGGHLIEVDKPSVFVPDSPKPLLTGTARDALNKAVEMLPDLMSALITRVRSLR